MKRDERARVLARAARLHRTQRFHVRVNFLGVLNMVCPMCGLIQKHRLMQRRYVVECSTCGAKYVPKLVLMLIPPGGRRAIPPDYIVPDAKGPATLQEAFPVGDMEYWRHGGCTHEMKVVASKDEGEDEEEQ